MGPLFFRAENPLEAGVVFEVLVASMGPLFFRAENGRLSARDLRRRCGFNGAALFQSGEHATGAWEGEDPAHASMGPLFFRAENRPPPKSLKDKGLQSGFREV